MYANTDPIQLNMLASITKTSTLLGKNKINIGDSHLNSLIQTNKKKTMFIVALLFYASCA